MSDSLSQASDSSGSSIDEEVSQCPICLQEITDKGFTDPCYHQYCTQCILQWIHQSPRCPLCNHPIVSLIRYSKLTNEPYKIPIATQQHQQQQPISTHSPSISRTVEYGRNATIDRAQVSLGIRKRQAVYRHGLRRIDNNMGRRTRVSENKQLLARELQTVRCQEWIKRELQVVLHTSDVGLFHSLVLSAMDTMDGDRQILGNILGSDSGLFVSELLAFADSSLGMYDYDRYVAYDTSR